MKKISRCLGIGLFLLTGLQAMENTLEAEAEKVLSQDKEIFYRLCLKYGAEPNTFKIADLLNEDGNFDLLNPIFEGIDNHVFITSNPEQFFRVKEKSLLLMVLMTPKSFLEQKLASSAAPFGAIMDEWDAENASIGFFYRLECWSNKNQWAYNLSNPISKQLEDNLFTNLAFSKKTTVPNFLSLTRNKSADWINLSQKISFSF